jgi:uncharacterized membrane protein
MFSIAHLHLVINHVPIVGSIFIFAMYIIALFFKNVFMQKVSLCFLVVVALSTAVSYVTGDGTKRAIEGLPQVSNAMIDIHETYARYSLIVMFIAGIVALGGVLLYSRKPKIPFYLHVSILVILLISVVLFAYVGLLGGEIMHTEIRS